MLEGRGTVGGYPSGDPVARSSSKISSGTITDCVVVRHATPMDSEGIAGGVRVGGGPEGCRAWVRRGVVPCLLVTRETR